MATNDIGRVTPIWKGFYSAQTTYELNDIVIDLSGSVWWHKSEELTTGVIPADGATWAAVIDMSVFSALIQEAITTAQTAVQAAQEAESEVAEDVRRAETAAQSAEASAEAASESAAGVGALAQAAEQSKTEAQTAATQAAESASSAGASATSAGSSAQTAEAAKTAAQTAATQAAGSAETASGAAAVVEQKKAEALAAIETKGEEVLQSIPEDYTELSGDVGDLKTQLNDIDDILPKDSGEIEALISGNQAYNTFEAQYAHQGAIGSTIAKVAKNATSTYVFGAVRKGEVYYVNARSTEDALAIYLTDASGIILDKFASPSGNNYYNNAMYTVPADGIMYLNCVTAGYITDSDSAPYYLKKKVYGYVSLVEVPSDIADLQTELTDLESSFESNKYIFTHLTSDAYEYGNISNTGEEGSTLKFVRTKGYIDPSITGFNVASGYKVAVCIWKPNGTFQRYSWVTSTSEADGLNYRFDHTNKYRIYIALTAETTIVDLAAIYAALTYQQDAHIASKRYFESKSIIDNLIAEKANTNSRLYSVMRNNYEIEYANAPTKLNFYNYSGTTQSVHPKVLYFPNGLFGHKYWMAYTPYPFSEVSYENPCVAYSEDGLNWTNIDGNPLDTPAAGYNSDTHLVYNGTSLECWWRLAVNATNTETIYRKISSDGITWGNAEEIISVTGNLSSLLSPAVIYDSTNQKYLMWVVATGGGHGIRYYEGDANAQNWTIVNTKYPSFVYNNKTYLAWHLDVIKDDNIYIYLIMCKEQDGDSWVNFITTSSDSSTYTTPYCVMDGNPDGWDVQMYRSSIVKIGEIYRIYYSAKRNSTYGIGISESPTLENFIGRLNY